MDKVLLVEAPNLVDLLRVRGSAVHETTAARGLDDAFLENDVVDAVVVGPNVVDPIQSVQRAYRLDPAVSVILLGESEHCKHLSDALRFSPFVGSDVTCRATSDTDLSVAIEDAAARTRTRRKHRATVAVLDAQVHSQRATPARAVNRELFTIKLLDVAPIGIMCLDDERRVVSINLEGARLFGTTERALLGRHLNTHMGDADRWNTFLTNAASARSSATFQHPNTGSAILEASAVALGPDDGYLVVLQDVTESQRAAEARELALSRAEEANRLKDEFVATISHELRTPLNAVVGWVRLLRSGTLPANKVAHALEVIERNADAQVRLVEDLLDLSRIVAGKMRLSVKPVAVGQVLQQTVESVRVAAEAKLLSLMIEVDTDLPEINADRERLEQVFWNLLINAVKFTPRRGTVRARAYRFESVVRVEVSDNGEGIRPEVLAYVFDPFRQAEGGTTRAHGGLGLGLAVVRRLVELHGGRVTAASDGADRGATFTVELPIGPLRVEATGEGTVEAALSSVREGLRTPDLHQATVLILDDEPDARELVAMLVQNAGGQARIVSTSAEAMSVLQSETVDLVISDIGMPDEDGYAFVRRVRKLKGPTSRVPIIALTAYAREQERSRALAAGFDAHLSKPVAVEDLIRTVSAMLCADPHQARD